MWMGKSLMKIASLVFGELKLLGVENIISSTRKLFADYSGKA